VTRVPASRIAALVGLLLAAALCAAASAARAQDDGPRVYLLAPAGAQNITVFNVVKRGDELPEPGSVTCWCCATPRRSVSRAAN
jgi:hypothetical protein